MTATSMTSTSAQTQVPLSENDFCNIPNDVLSEIFIGAIHTGEIHSLLLTDRRFYKFISGNIPLWESIFEKRFHGSFDPTESGINPMVAYGDKVAMRKGMKSNLCKIEEIPVGDQTLQVIVQNDQLFLFSRKRISPTTLKEHCLVIWDLKNKKRIETPPALDNALYGYVDEVAIHKNIVYVGKRAETREGNFSIEVFDLKTGEKLKSFDFGKGDTFSARFDISVQGNLLYGYLLDGTRKSITLKIWDTSTGDQVVNNKLELEQGIRCVLLDNYRIFLGCDDGKIQIWNCDTLETPVCFKSASDYSVLQIHIHNDILLSSGHLESTAWGRAEGGKKYVIEGDCQLIHAGMLFTRDRGNIKIWDEEKGEKLRIRKERGFASHDSSFAVHKSKLLVSRYDCVQIFDFGAPFASESATARYTELLRRALLERDREKITDYVGKLVAADPANEELIEIICAVTEGDSLPFYEFSTGAPFDYRKSIQSAPFYLIKNAVSEFISKLTTERNIQLNFAEFEDNVEDTYETEFSDNTSETDEPYVY